MSELRQDPITHDWVIVTPERAKRPHDTGPEHEAHRCPFCPGNETLSAESVDTLTGVDGRWSVRAVANKFPVLVPSSFPNDGYDVLPEGWRRFVGYGRHEVIIETRDHSATMGNMPVTQVRQVVEMYLRRFHAHVRARGPVRQVVLFRNHGPRAGTSLAHPHSQMVATPVVSPDVRHRMAAEVAFFDRTGCCGLCTVIAEEQQAASRVVLRTDRFVTLAPYASRAPYHVQVVPLRHCPQFADVEPAELDDLAVHLTRLLGAFHRDLDDPDYNLVIFTPPVDQVHAAANHWYIDILPRLTTPAGFELGSRIVVNVETPETAAAKLRAALDPGKS
jgi:UDPglucose--hexose-1-phosphate uridylyltransferase